MDWVSPTGFNDPDTVWAAEENAYDENTTSFASTTTVGSYLELTLGAAINCDKVRVYVVDLDLPPPFPEYYDPDISIWVYYLGGWNEIFSGVVTKNTWIEKPIGSIQSVDKMRIKARVINYNVFYVYEAEFNHVGVAIPIVAHHYKQMAGA